MEKCDQSLEKLSLHDHAKVEYKALLEEGVGVLPNWSPVLTGKTAALQIVKEGWALRANKKACRFNESQKKYLSAKFNIGQATGRKMDADSVAKDMRRALGTDGVRLFKVSEFLTSQQITSYFSRLALRVRQQSPDSDDIQAAEEENNFASMRQVAVSSIQLQHPLEFNQYDICKMSNEGTLKQLKLGMLHQMCQDLELDVPVPQVRRKAPYLSLLNEATSKCSCHSDG